MSGHSKWATIKHQKGIKDAKRSKTFSQMTKEIMVVSRNGENPETNYSLKLAIQKAKSIGLPKENIERAIQKGSGAGNDLNNIEEIVYEGFGPGGVGIIVKVLTEKRGRSLQEMRLVFDKNNGNLSGKGSVMFNFDFVGEIEIENVKQNDELEEFLIGLDLKDYEFLEENKAILWTEPKNLSSVSEKLEKYGLNIVSSDFTYLPKNYISISEENKILLEKLIQKIEELDDVSGCWNNAE